MRSLNRATIIGNCGRDPEIRTFQDGTRVANLSIATTNSWKDKNSGEAKERTEWHRVVVFVGTLVELCEKYVRKGDPLFIEGAIETRKWTDQSGNDRYSTEIVVRQVGGRMILLGGKKDADDRSAPAQQSSPAFDLDDDIPF